MIQFLPALLTLHLMGLVIMAGTTLVNFVTLRTLWKLPDVESEKQMGLLLLTGKLSRVISIGAAMLIITGFAMMFITHGVFGEQLWFRIKFALVIILVVNGIIANKRGTRFSMLFTEKRAECMEQLNSLRIKLNRFYIIQLTLFIMIILLSVFKFN